MTRKAISTDKIAPAVGPFSAAVWAGEFLYLSGQVGVDPASDALVGDDVAAQTVQIFKNAQAVLEAAGKSLDDVVKANVYLANMADFTAMNAAYATFFAKPYPARTTIGVAALPLGAKVEIEFVAR
jgi:2-iminobutanoate/2-iminopropanoate deaminase